MELVKKTVLNALFSSACFASTWDQAHTMMPTAPVLKGVQRATPYVEVGTNWILFPYLRVGLLSSSSNTHWIFDGAVQAALPGSVSIAFGARRAFNRWAVGPEVILGKVWRLEDVCSTGPYVMAGVRTTYSLKSSNHWRLTLGGYLCKHTSTSASPSASEPIISVGAAHVF